MSTSILWVALTFAQILFLIFLWEIAGEIFLVFKKRLRANPIQRLEHSLNTIQNWLDRLESGQSIEARHWEELKSIVFPWNQILEKNLRALRSEGAAIVPTLRRVRQTLSEEIAWIHESENQLAQSKAQAWMGIFLVMGSSVVAVWMIPEVLQDGFLFYGIVSLGLIWAGLGLVWIRILCQKAIWAKLSEKDRDFVRFSAFAQEQFLGFLEIGFPPDLAWANVKQEIGQQCPALLSLWQYSKIGVTGIQRSKAIYCFQKVGIEVGNLIQHSLLEGQQCKERLQVLFQSHRMEWRALVSQELRRLPTVSLQALFFCTFPAAILPMAWAVLVLASKSWGE